MKMYLMLSTSSVVEDKRKPFIAEKKVWIKCLKTFCICLVYTGSTQSRSQLVLFIIYYDSESQLCDRCWKKVWKKTSKCEKQMSTHWPSPDLAAISLAGWRPGSIMNLVKIGDRWVRVIFLFGGHLYLASWDAIEPGLVNTSTGRL